MEQTVLLASTTWAFCRDAELQSQGHIPEHIRCVLAAGVATERETHRQAWAELCVRLIAALELMRPGLHKADYPPEDAAWELLRHHHGDVDALDYVAASHMCGWSPPKPLELEMIVAGAIEGVVPETVAGASIVTSRGINGLEDALHWMEWAASIEMSDLDWAVMLPDMAYVASLGLRNDLRDAAVMAGPWPDSDPDSALNERANARALARRAIEISGRRLEG